MANDRTRSDAVLPAEVPLVLFHAAGVALGVEASAIEGVLDAGQARQSGISSGTLAELLGTSAAAEPPAAKVLLVKRREDRFGMGVDSLDEIAAIPTTALQLLPEPLSYFRGPRTFWGATVRAGQVVLLVDVDRLPKPAAAPGEASCESEECDHAHDTIIR